MEFKDFKVDNIYFTVSEGQYLGAFYIIQKNDKVMKMMMAYHGGVVRIEIVEEEDLKEGEEFDWLHHSYYISKKPKDENIKESLHEMIVDIFERSSYIIKGFKRKYG